MVHAWFSVAQYAARFDGLDDYVEIVDYPNYSTAASMDAFLALACRS